MPKVVDHAIWRSRVTEAASELIAEEGLAGMTFRRLAARLGCSTTVISHYFSSRTELLESVYDATNEAASRWRRDAAGDPARSPVEMLEDVLPVSPGRLRLWRIWLSFWNSALFDGELAERHRRGIAGTRGDLRRHFVRHGMTQDAAARAAEDMMQTILGIAMQAVFDQKYWFPARQLAAFRRSVARITAASTATATVTETVG